MNKIYLTLVIGIFNIGLAQYSTSANQPVYYLNHKIELPVTFGLLGINYLGSLAVSDKTPVTMEEIASLDVKDVWSIDRNALEQDYFTSIRENAGGYSDNIMNASIILPIILTVDNNIRSDIINIFFLYLETHAINSSLYVFGGVRFTERLRPFVYYPEVSFETKTNAGGKQSFFSGHVSTTAVSSFFLAKVYSDYHPNLGRTKWLLYTGALIPPVSVGYMRYKALRHFPTDIVTGLVVGAATGILVPHLHKIKFGKNKNISILPSAENMIGLSINLKF